MSYILLALKNFYHYIYTNNAGHEKYLLYVRLFIMEALEVNTYFVIMHFGLLKLSLVLLFRNCQKERNNPSLKQLNQSSIVKQKIHIVLARG